MDDLVAIRDTKREVAYQLKSGLGRLPRAATSESDTVDALRQAGRELRDPTGAQVVGLVFGQLSSRMKVVARWLAGDDTVAIAATTLKVLAEIMGFDASVDWTTFRPRLRILEVGSTVDLGAAIDLELTSCYASPADRVSVSDALRELVAVHSDADGATLQPIDRARLTAWLTARGLPAMSIAETVGDQRPVLVRNCERYLHGVEKLRGGLPEIPREGFVTEITQRLANEDLVLIGGGGTGKTELEAQVVRQYLSKGWLPIVIRREDLALFGGDIALAAGAGGRTDLPALVTQLLAHSPENLIVIVDGIDEIRRTAGTEQVALAASLLTVLEGIRSSHPDRTRLHLLLSCRRFDWSRMAGSGWSAHFTAVNSPTLSAAELAAVPTSATDFRSLLTVLQDPVRTLALSRPILLRMAYELWLHRHTDDAPQSGSALSDISSEIALWRTYYSECVCGVDIGLIAALSPGDVMKCHDDMARRHVDADRFVLSVLATPIEMNHPKAFPWLRSVEVATTDDQTLGSLNARFFHPSYTDYALALVVATDTQTRHQWARSMALSVSLYPVWRRLPSLWIGDAASVHRVSALLADTAIPHLTKRALLEGYLEIRPDGDFLTAIAKTVAAAASNQLLLDFIELASATSTPTVAVAWLSELVRHGSALGGAGIDELLRVVRRILETGAPTDAVRALGRDLAALGRTQALREGMSAGGLNNARVLARNSAVLLSLTLTREAIGALPIKAEDWADVGDVERAAAIAADVRQVLCDQTVIERMHDVDVDATVGFLAQIIGAAPPTREGKVDLGAHQQTSRLNLTMRLSDSWEASWYAVSELAPGLFDKDKRYLQLSVLAWCLYGFGSHGGSDGKSFPHEAPGDFWLHDRSYSWWRADFHTPTAHVRLATSGFDFVESRAVAGEYDFFLYLSDLAMELRWAGLPAILLEIAGRVLGATPDESGTQLAEAAAKLLTHERSLHMLELRDAAIEALPTIASHAAPQTRDTLWIAIRELADLRRIADDEPAAPDEERERRSHAEHVAKYQAELDALPDDASHSWERSAIQMQLDMLAQFTPERAIAMLNNGYRRRLEWRQQAQRGELPLEHPDIKTGLAALAHFAKESRFDLLPDDLRALHDKGLAVLGPTGMPQNKPPVRFEMNAAESRRLSPDSTDNPRARFCLEVRDLHSEHLSRRLPWEASEASRLLALIEDNRETLGLDEPTPLDDLPGDPDDTPEWHAQQPRPKKAWARLILLYLEHIADGQPTGLSAESIRRLVELTSDRDPLVAEPASTIVPYKVRSEAAAALFPLCARGSGPADIVGIVTRLLSDPAPAVRRAVYFGAARWLRGRDADVYSLILRTFAEREVDRHLLEVGSALLLFPGPSEGDLEAWGAACVALLKRLVSLTGVSDRTIDQLGTISAHLFVRGERATVAAVHNVLSPPAIPGITATLGWGMATSAIEQICDGADPKRALELLAACAERSVASTGIPKDIEPQVGREELILAFNLATVLAAALTGQRAIQGWTLTHQAFPSTPRRERIAPALRDIELDLRRIWRRVVDPWLASDWYVSLQRMLIDAVRVAREVAVDDPDASEDMLRSWGLESRISSLEGNVRDELGALIGSLLPTAKDRDMLVRLLHELDGVGHVASRELIKRLALEARAT